MTNATATQAQKGPARAPLRTEAKRSSLRDRLRDIAATVKESASNDKFHIDDALKPEGVELQWKKYSVVGQEDPYYIASMQRAGWEVMTVDDVPGLAPAGITGPIIKEGMVLMGQVKELTHRARERDRLKAMQQIRDREKANGHAPTGTAPRAQTDINGQPLGMRAEMMVPIAVED